MIGEILRRQGGCRRLTYHGVGVLYPDPYTYCAAHWTMYVCTSEEKQFQGCPMAEKTGEIQDFFVVFKILALRLLSGRLPA